MDLPCHQECKYHGFLGLVQWCRHPDHLGPIYPNREAIIEAADGKCKSKVEWEAKVMPGIEPPWPMPVNLRELFPIEREKPRFCTHTIQKQQNERDK